MRVSGGHLCEAEAPTEPAGETAVRCAVIRFPIPSVIAKPCKRLWQSVSLQRGIRILSRSVLRMTHRLVIAKAVRCAEVRYILLLLKKQAKACFFAFKALFIHSILYRM